MRTYESIVIFHPESAEEARKEVQDKLRGVVEKLGGEVQTVDDWGRRKLAYPVRKHRYGQMTRVQLHADPKVVHELDLVFRHSESVIKYMTALMSERLLNQKPVVESTSSDDHGDGENGRRKRRE